MVDTVLYVPPTTEFIYPESDGEPMGETGIHALCILTSMSILRTYFRHQAEVYIGANMFMYYTQGAPSDVVAPDLFVTFDTDKNERRVWKIWKEGKAPDFILEVTSEATKGKDRWFKRGLYEELGVTEYFQFDPLSEYLNPSLQGFRLANGMYQPIIGNTENDTVRLESKALNMHLQVEDKSLRFYEANTGTKLLTHEETEDELTQLKAEYQKLKDKLSFPEHDNMIE